MSSLLAEQDSVIGDRLAADLADVEQRFAAELASDLACVNALTEHVERYRGKMLRPTLVLVSAMAVEPQRRETPEAQRVLACVTEMVHMATLVHDDVLDEAQMRRQGATINQLRGNEPAVMLGDYLISHAYHLCSSLGRPSISRAIADATNRVCEGELLQLSNRDNWQIDERTYFEIIRRKTASLCGTACALAGELAEAEPATCRALHEFGESLGMAFQIGDDVLDLAGRSETVGKTLGRDLEKGKLTLPLIRYLESVSPSSRERILSMLEEELARAKELGHDGRLNWLARDVAASEALDEARTRAARLIGSAKAALTGQLDDSPARALLLNMADAVLSREY